jgi:hypothetical protein
MGDNLSQASSLEVAEESQGVTAALQAHRSPGGDSRAVLATRPSFCSSVACLLAVRCVMIAGEA